MLTSIYISNRKYILYDALALDVAAASAICMISVPARWQKDDMESMCRLAFEELNVGGLMLLYQPCLSLFGLNAVNGLVIDVGAKTTGK